MASHWTILTYHSFWLGVSIGISPKVPSKTTASIFGCAICAVELRLCSFSKEKKNICAMRQLKPSVKLSFIYCYFKRLENENIWGGSKHLFCSKGKRVKLLLFVRQVTKKKKQFVNLAIDEHLNKQHICYVNGRASKNTFTGLKFIQPLKVGTNFIPDWWTLDTRAANVNIKMNECTHNKAKVIWKLLGQYLMACQLKGDLSQ